METAIAKFIQHAGSMFPGLPSYSPVASHLPQITEGTVTLADMPKISGPGDWLAMRARLRLVMEDPRQLLSGCVTDYPSNSFTKPEMIQRASPSQAWME